MKAKASKKKASTKKATKKVKARKYDLSKKESILFKEWLQDRPKKMKEVKLSRNELINHWRKFRKNVARIRALNAENKGETEFGLNELSDLDDDEFRTTRAGTVVPDELKKDLELHPIPDEDVVDLKEFPDDGNIPDEIELKDFPQLNKRSTEALPKSFDWRRSKKKVVSSVKNQGRCGSCWTFATAANVEARWALSGHRFESLSEENILDCARGKSMNGCNGGWPGAAIDWIKRNGLRTDKKYPYQGKVTKCKRVGGTSAKVPGYTMIGKNPKAMMEAIRKYGPIIVVVDANDVWKHYKRGVIKRGCGTEPNHGVIIVGWKTVSGVPVWIVKNSWGTDWGINGYAYVKRSKGKGICGINVWPHTAL
jgi:hypothetical protein